jgi:hypothetical protein
MNTILQVVVVTLLLSIAQVSGKLVRDQHDCKWTAADGKPQQNSISLWLRLKFTINPHLGAGSKFDLTNLIKHAGDGDYVASSPQYKYYMNVCGDTTLIPHQCKKKSIPVSPGYVSAAPGHVFTHTATARCMAADSLAHEGNRQGLMLTK